ncbi:MAG: serine/threonine protein phosphatase [bacterium]|nr:serine/threonine protein phosphatase [bacterium]
MESRLIAVGDIHGEYYKLESLISKLDIQNTDRLVFLGDYVDRGLYSKQVVDKLLELSKFCSCEFLKGNHEYYMLKALNGDKNAEYFFMTYGGVQTIESYGNVENILKIHGDFYRNLKQYYVTDDYIFVHGGINPDIPLEEHSELELLMIRDEFIYRPTNLLQKVIFGHTPFEKPFIAADKIGLDTGAGKFDTGYITAVILPEESFVSSL